MAIAFDSSFENNNNGNITITCTPVGDIDGCIVFIATAGNTSDVTGVTADGNAMTQTTDGVFFHDGSEKGAIEAYFYGSNLGSASFDVVVSGGGRFKWACVILLTAASDTQEEADDGIQGSGANPSGTLALGGVTSFVAEGWWSGRNAPGNVSPLTGWTSRQDHDFGAAVAGCYTYDTVGSADVTYGYSAGNDEYAILSVGVSEVGGAGLAAGVYAYHHNFHNLR